MKILVIFLALILVTGCLQSPAKVAKNMPLIWENTTANVNNFTEPVIRNVSQSVQESVEMSDVTAPIKFIKV